MESIRASTAAPALGLAGAVAANRPAPVVLGGSSGVGSVPAVPQASVRVPERPAALESEPRFDAADMRKRLGEIAQLLNEQLRATNTNLAFGIDPIAKRTVITVTDRGGDLVREIPGEVFLRVARHLEQFIREGAGSGSFKGMELDKFL